MSKPNEFPPPPEQPFVSHLIELRDRLMRAVVAILVIFLALFAFANDLYTLLAEPLLRHMPEGTNMIATEVASPFLTPFKLTLVLSVFIAVPFLLYQAWGFIAPALYATEKRLVFPLLLSSTILFYTGMAFAYFVVFPLVFGFLTGVVPDGVEVMTDISRYLDFVLKLFFAFGIAFEVPIATILVIWSGLTTRKDLAKKRPYIIVAAFVIGMLLTPPDVISQTLLALPMWFLFEVGLVMSRFYKKSSSDEDPEDDPEGNPEGNPENSPDGSSSSAQVSPYSEGTDLATKPKGEAPAESETPKSQSGLEPTPQLEEKSKLAETIDHDDSPGSADHYSELGETHEESSDEDMEREFDRLEAEEDKQDSVTHPEFEPIEEERTRPPDQKTTESAFNEASDDEPIEASSPSESIGRDDQATTSTDPKKDDELPGPSS